MAIKINGVDMPTTINEKTIDPQGAYVLADKPELWEPQRSNNFELIVNVGTLNRAGSLGNETNAPIDGKYAQEVLRISVVSAPIPHFTQSVIEVRRGNSSIKAAGIPTFGEGTIVVNDFIGADTKAILMAWQNLSYNVRTEKVGLMADYKKDATLVEYTPDYQAVRKWHLYGCWVSGLSETEYSNEGNDKKQITCTIQYDRAMLDTTELV